MVPPLDETIICFGDGGIAEDIGVENRIDSHQAARDHKPAARAAFGPGCGYGAENAQGGDDCKRDENPISTHGSLLLSARVSLGRHLG
jgi:hypothetical protein